MCGGKTLGISNQKKERVKKRAQELARRLEHKERTDPDYYVDVARIELSKFNVGF